MLVQELDPLLVDSPVAGGCAGRSRTRAAATKHRLSLIPAADVQVHRAELEQALAHPPAVFRDRLVVSEQPRPVVDGALELNIGQAGFFATGLDRPEQLPDLRRACALSPFHRPVSQQLVKGLDCLTAEPACGLELAGLHGGFGRFARLASGSRTTLEGSGGCPGRRRSRSRRPRRRSVRPPRPPALSDGPVPVRVAHATPYFLNHSSIRFQPSSACSLR